VSRWPLTGGSLNMVNAMDLLGNTKLRVKVHDSEFEAEGPTATVNKQYEAFLEALDKVDSAKAESRELGDSKVTRDGLPPAIPTGQKNPVHEQIDSALFRRIFAENGSVISLKALPKTDTAEADAILLLIYGYQVLRQSEYPVTGVRLMQAAKQSGLHQVDRIDRKIAAHEQYILTAGTRRGKKYQLNNQGVSHAEDIVRSLLG
jgi:hypothetical protein